MTQEVSDLAAQGKDAFGRIDLGLGDLSAASAIDATPINAPPTSLGFNELALGKSSPSDAPMREAEAMGLSATPRIEV